MVFVQGVPLDLVFRNYIYEVFHIRSQRDLIYTDFNKAFDTINYNSLLSVIKQSGIGELLLS